LGANSGFSLDASVRIAGHDRAGLERPPPTPGMEEVEPRLEQRPRISPARGPPAWDDPPVEAVPDWDALAQPQPESVFDQRVQW
jgi:hypothetical protein